MKQFNFLFYIVLFLGFALPSNSSFFFRLPGISLQIRELAFLLLPILNILGKSTNSVTVGNIKLRRYILLFFILILITEFFKAHYYFQGIGSFFKTLRIGLPLFSSFILVLSGIRVDIIKVWNTLLWAISISTILSIISLFIPLPIYPTIEDADYLASTGGRLTNANAPFGIIGIYLLYKDNDKWFNKGLLVKVTSILSVIALVLTFNRTYMGLAVLAVIYLTFSTFSFRNALKYLTIPIVFIVILFWSYNTFDIIQRQVDNRILSIVFGEKSLYESVYENNREVIFDGVILRIKEGYWLFGLPLNIPIFTWFRALGAFPMSTTDTTLVNVLLRYGIVPFILFLSILRRLISKNKSNFFLYTMTIYFIASLNMDAMMRHNSILFLIIIFFITKKIENEKNTNAGAHQRSRLR